MDGSRIEREPRNWTARVIAPLALAAAIAVVYLVASGAIGGLDEDSGSEQSENENVASRTTCDDPDAQDAVEAGYYVVSEEDTAGMSGIADKTCIPLERLQNLNPKLDPNTLQVANCVDLIRDGCKALSE